MRCGAGPLATAETASKPASRRPGDAVSTRLYCWLCRVACSGDARLCALFNHFDEDQDGRLSAAELYQLVSKEGVGRQRLLSRRP